MNETPSTHTILGLLPFTVGKKVPPSYSLQDDEDRNDQQVAFTHMAAALLAVDHFNERNTAVVPELESLLPQHQNCTLQLADSDLVFVNTDSDSTTVSRFLVQQAYQQNKILAMVGPYTNVAALAAAQFATGMDIPLISHGADDISFTRLDAQPRVAITNVNLHAMGEVVVNFFRSKGRTNFLATVAVSKEIGLQYSQTVDNAAKEANFTHHESYTIAPPFYGFEPNRGVGFALERVKSSGFRNIFLVLNTPNNQLSIVADYAEEFGLNTGEYVWMIASERMLNPAEIAHLASTSSNVTKLINGMSFVTPLDGFTSDPDTDTLLNEWKKQNETFVSRVNQLHPIKKADEEGYFRAESDFFYAHNPLPGAGFFYDAVISAGLGKCRQEANEKTQEGKGGNKQGQGPRRLETHGDSGPQHQLRYRKLQKSRPPGRSAWPPKNAFFEAILDTEFVGATGQVKFRESKLFAGSRPRETVTFGAYNFRPVEPSEQRLGNNTTYSTWYYLTDIHRGPTHAGEWEPTEYAPFIFSNGLATPPLLNRDLPEQNFLSEGVRITGLAFMSIALLATLASALFVFFWRGAKPIKSAQPTFLFLLIFGAMTMSSAILPLSFDESDGWSDQMLDAACMSTPWLVSMGYNIIHLALFSKLYRIDKVMQFRRVQVKVSHVTGPFVCNLLATIAVLVAWTVGDPLQWEREVINTVTLETYGECRSDNALAYFIPLVSLMGLSTVACGLMAYKCRDIDARFSDAMSIFYTIFVQFQALLLGIPILVILADSSADATYLGRSLLIFVIAMTAILLMIARKAMIVFSKEFDSSGRRSSASRHGGTGQVTIKGVTLSQIPSSGFTSSRRNDESESRSSRGPGSRRSSTQSISLAQNAILEQSTSSLNFAGKSDSGTVATSSITRNSASSSMLEKTASSVLVEKQSDGSGAE